MRKHALGAFAGALAIAGVGIGPSFARVTANTDSYNFPSSPPAYRVVIDGNRAVLQTYGPGGIFFNDVKTGTGSLRLFGNVARIAGVNKVAVKFNKRGFARLVVHFKRNFDGIAKLRYGVAQVRSGRVVSSDRGLIRINVNCGAVSCS